MFNPAKAAKNIRNEFIDYITTSFHFADKNLSAQFVDQLKTGICQGPILEINDIFKPGKSINELIKEGVLSRLFNELEGNKSKKMLPLDRPLYYHQEQAIRNIVNGNNAVISTGTGSGKTNCFLIPVINELLKEKEEGRLTNGVRALIIYPMNALANDQMKNLRKILMNYPDITFGVYNGATEEKDDDAVQVYKAMFENDEEEKLRKPLQNELLSRQKMKEKPPHILITNYAMLEHLLLRPNDDILFSNSLFKFVVLDEAHIYSGVTGIETSMLLRRLKARMHSESNVQFILTSATLGDESCNDDVLTFANNLCGETFTLKNIIRGQRVSFTPSKVVNEYPISLYNELADERNLYKNILKKNQIPFDEEANEESIIYDLLIKSDKYNTLRQCAKHIIDIHEISAILCLDIDTTINFISLCTKASKDGIGLIDARYHFFVRCLEGCYFSFANGGELYLNRKKSVKNDLDEYTVFEIALCRECGNFSFVGKIENNKLIQEGDLSKDSEYFHLCNEEVEDDESEKEYYYLCPHCGTIVSERLFRRKTPCLHLKDHFVKVAKFSSETNKCGSCNIGTCERFYLGNDAATSVLATSLYEELPTEEYKLKKSTLTTNSIFDFQMIEEPKEVYTKGRQFLVFSDGRQDAARFACYLTKYYQEFLRRRGICNLIIKEKDKLAKQDIGLDTFIKKLKNYFSNNRTFSKSIKSNDDVDYDSERNATIAVLNELVRHTSSTSLSALGILQFEYLGNNDFIVDKLHRKLNVSKEKIKNLLNILVFDAVKSGCITPADNEILNAEDRNYIFYSEKEPLIVLNKDRDNRNNYYAWLPTKRLNGKSIFYKTNKLRYVMDTLGCDEKTANTFLTEYFEYLLNNSHKLARINSEDTYAFNIKDFVLKSYLNPAAKWYRCKKCKKATQFNLNNKCILNKCNGELEEIKPNELFENNHYSKLYFSERMQPLFIKEHTAQLSKKESAEYQEQFIKKDINALSCSTTFEMGVDVGDLETVFLRDVPPLPSNYAQRAGRAGRSLSASAFCLTYAKLSSHDLSFYKQPLKMISGEIYPPIFKIDNLKIVSRHINAIALSMFFKKYEHIYNNNDADVFLNNGGSEEFVDWLKSRPEELKSMIKKSIPNVNNMYDSIGIENWKWLDNLIGEEGVLTVALREYDNNLIEFSKAIENAKNRNDFNSAANYQRKKDLYSNNKLISFLASNNVLPKYGFPVDTVELEVKTTASNINKLRLSRDLSMAISEYAPSSEVIADGRLYTSRYIKKSVSCDNKKEWHTSYIGQCQNESCKTLIYSKTPIISDFVVCPSCGEKVPKENFNESIEPRDGFATESKSEDVPMTKQEKSYRSDDFYIGDTASKIINKKKYDFNGVEVEVQSTSNDSLLVKTYNSFYVCSECGYAVSEDDVIENDKKATNEMKSKPKELTIKNKHKMSDGLITCTSNILKRYSLHYKFKTDVVKIDFNCDTSDYKTMISVMYAFLYAMCDSLNIERKDVKACLSSKVIDFRKVWSLIIYDAAAGGAGHVRRLVDEDGTILHYIFVEAYKRVSECSCDPSCYNCLRSYENRKIHDDLDRKLAADFLLNLISKR